MTEKCRYSRNCKKFNMGKCPLLNTVGDDFCIKLFKINKLQDNALLTEKQRERIVLRLDEDESDKVAFDRLKQIEQNVEKFVDYGGNLYLYSKNCGVGKTSWALRLLNTYIERIWYKSDITCRGLFLNVPYFLNALKENFDSKSENIEHIKKYIYDADLIVWDDVATKGLTVFETESLLNYIDGRIQRGRANIYTSNLAGVELKKAVGDRLYSRVMNQSEIITLRGVDKRGII